MKIVLSVLGAELVRLELDEPAPAAEADDPGTRHDPASTVASETEIGSSFGFIGRRTPGDVEA